MKFLGSDRRDVTCLVVGAAVVAAALCLFVDGRIANEADQMLRRLEARDGSDKEPSAVHKCDGGTNVELTATKEVPLKFQCAVEASSLSPKKTTSFENVYQYTVGADSQKQCQSATNSAVSLNSLVEGAKLAEENAGPKSPNNEKPVYVFTYSAEPTNEQHLCYTCNQASSSSSGSRPVERSEPAGQETVACTVFIRVPKKEEPTTSSSTPSTSSAFGLRAMRAAIGAAGGCFLAVMFAV